jgi:replicative DNA helicase
MTMCSRKGRVREMDYPSNTNKPQSGLLNRLLQAETASPGVAVGTAGMNVPFAPQSAPYVAPEPQYAPPAPPTAPTPYPPNQPLSASPPTLLDVLVAEDRKVAAGQLGGYLPVPTGFDPLDNSIGGGLKQGELMLVGGAQGLGKTIWCMQVARNLAVQGHCALYASFELNEEQLLDRLICMESIDPANPALQRGVRMKDLREFVVSMSKQHPNAGLYDILNSVPAAAASLRKMQAYCRNLYLMKANPTKTILAVLEATVQELKSRHQRVILFVDYLQKVPVPTSISASTGTMLEEDERVTIIVEGLKNLAMSQDVAVVAIVASDREGLKSKRLRLHHLRGSSALDYECDIAIIMNGKFNILSKQHIEYNQFKADSYKSWVVFTIEKNRAGASEIDIEFQMRTEYFSFNPHGQMVEQKLIDGKVTLE